jgi:hypothetical protein
MKKEATKCVQKLPKINDKGDQNERIAISQCQQLILELIMCYIHGLFLYPFSNALK